LASLLGFSETSVQVKVFAHWVDVFVSLLNTGHLRTIC